MNKLLLDCRTSPRPSENGYAMAVLLVALSVMAVLMTAAMPVWKQMAQREKEAELVFRGEQYARAIGLFQRRHGPGTLPPSLDILLEEHALRKKFKDPITNDEFDVVRQGQAGAIAGSAVPGGTPTRAPSTGRPPAPGGISAGAVGGIIGVASKSKAQSIRVFNGRTHYNEWAFVYQPPTQPGARPGASPSRTGATGPPTGTTNLPPGSQQPRGQGGAGGRPAGPPGPIFPAPPTTPRRP